MESLTDSQQENLRKMSSERIQGRLMRVGMDEEQVYAMSRPELLEAMAKVMLSAETAASDPSTKTEVQMQFELMRMQLEQRDREHAREMALQRELYDAQLKMQMERDQRAREDNYRRQEERDESLVAKTKRYGQAVQYALTNMPAEAGELPAWFYMVDNVWTNYGVPDELKSKLIIPKLTTRAKSLLTHLPASDQASYPKVKAFLLKQYQLGSREYRARFLHASRSTGETWVSYASRLTNLFRYYTNSRDCRDFDALFDLCVTDKLRDSLPHANLKHCLAVEKDQCLSSQELANTADQYESNFFPDGRYKGLSVTAGQSGGKLKPPSNGKNAVADQAQATQNDVTNVSVDRGNMPNNKSPSPKRKLFNPHFVKRSVKCWKCGQMGHTSKEHYNTSSVHYSGKSDKPSSKPMAVNACVTQTADSDDEITPHCQANVQINHCSAFEHKTQYVSLGDSSPEGPRFDFSSEKCEDCDSSEGENTIGLEPESVLMTCESVADIDSLTSSLNYVSVDIEASDRTYKAILSY